MQTQHNQPGRTDRFEPSTPAVDRPGSAAGMRSGGRAGQVLGIVAALIVSGAIVALAWSVVETSNAKITASTETGSLLSVGTLSLDGRLVGADLRFEADGMVPGQPLQSCIDISYDGSLPASIRLHARSDTSADLAPFVDLAVMRSAVGVTCAQQQQQEQQQEGQPAAGLPLYVGLLDELWRDHGDYGNGLIVLDDAADGSVFAVNVTAAVADDNRAQGLTTDFFLTIEARP